MGIESNTKLAIFRRFFCSRLLAFSQIHLIRGDILEAAGTAGAEVRASEFPEPSHTYTMPALERERFESGGGLAPAASDRTIDVNDSWRQTNHQITPGRRRR